jgi:arylsulfatase A-like enzyme
MAKPPHIIIFNPDQWRADAVGHLDNPAAVTPTLDALVETEAVSFSQAYCQNPVCTPSRCSFMTGWYPHVRGHRTMFHMLHPDEPCLLKTLKDNGYFVWWGGKNDLVPAQHGFDAYCDIKHDPGPVALDLHRDAAWRGAPDDDTGYSFFAGRIDGDPGDLPLDSDVAHDRGPIDFIERYDGDQPLCIYLPLTYPHPPYGVEEPWFSMIDRAAMSPRVAEPADWSGKPSLLPGIADRLNMRGWTEDRWDELRATYLGMCARVDHQFGLVLDALRAAGIYDDTAVFLFSDHGDFTGDYGLVEKTQNTFEDCLTRVPLVVKPPIGTPIEPGVRDGLAELIDVPATIEALTGIGPFHTHFGRSLLPMIADAGAPGRDAVFAEGGRLAGEEPAREMESPSSSDPAALYWPRVSLTANDHVAHSKAVMCRTPTHKYVRRLYEQDELYDLAADPHELTNRIDDPGCSGTIADLRERMLTFFLETGDVVPWKTDHRH